MTSHWHKTRLTKDLVAAGNAAWNTLASDFRTGSVVGIPVVTPAQGGRILARLLAAEAANDA